MLADRYRAVLLKIGETTWSVLEYACGKDNRLLLNFNDSQVELTDEQRNLMQSHHSYDYSHEMGFTKGDLLRSSTIWMSD